MFLCDKVKIPGVCVCVGGIQISSQGFTDVTSEISVYITRCYAGPAAPPPHISPNTLCWASILTSCIRIISDSPSVAATAVQDTLYTKRVTFCVSPSGWLRKPSHPSALKRWPPFRPPGWTASTWPHSTACRLDSEVQWGLWTYYLSVGGILASLLQHGTKLLRHHRLLLWIRSSRLHDQNSILFF